MDNKFVIQKEVRLCDIKSRPYYAKSRGVDYLESDAVTSSMCSNESVQLIREPIQVIEELKPIIEESLIIESEPKIVQEPKIIEEIEIEIVEKIGKLKIIEENILKSEDILNSQPKIIEEITDEKKSYKE
jgi:hypothetical protein